MWELFQIMLKNNLTPNQVLLLFGIKQGISLPQVTNDDKLALEKLGYLMLDDGKYTMSAEAKSFIVHLDNYFIKAKKSKSINPIGTISHEMFSVKNIITIKYIFPIKKNEKPVKQITVVILSESYLIENVFDNINKEYKKAIIEIKK